MTVEICKNPANLPAFANISLCYGLSQGKMLLLQRVKLHLDLNGKGSHPLSVQFPRRLITPTHHYGMIPACYERRESVAMYRRTGKMHDGVRLL